MYSAVFLTLSLLTSTLYSMTKGGGDSWYLGGKMICAAVFVLAAVIALAFRKKRSAFCWFILVGSLLGAFGDFCLAWSYTAGQVWFYIGVGSFALGHITYLCGLWSEKKPTLRAWIISGVLCALTGSWIFLNHPDFKGMMIPILAYLVITCLLWGNALAAASLAKGDHALTLFAVGVTLFAFSDLILGSNMVLDFRTVLLHLFPGATVNTAFSDAINAITYFSGQTLIACTIWIFGWKVISKHEIYLS